MSPSRRLLLLSFLMLFVELVLIRWAAANVVYLAYFSNFVLLASFLGIGVGFLRANAEKDRFGWAPLALAGLCAFLLFFPARPSGANGSRFVGLFGMFALPIGVSLPIVFAGTTLVMAAIAEGVARQFKRFAALDAYRLDIGGSLLGIVAFSILSFLEARPVVWGIVAALILWVLLRPAISRTQMIALVSLVLLLGAGSVDRHDHWSPYYKVTASDPTSQGVIAIDVNGLPHQSILPLGLLKTLQPFYLYPYSHIPANPMRDVLVVGAGNGNDVAVALSMGAEHVDAVEIDPVIQAIGRDRHPARPYEDPRVTTVIGDGRAFLERESTKYDLIVFALPDSLTLVSGQSSLRLESYLFTLEAMRSVRDHLAAGGAFTLYNYYRPDTFDRFAETITQAFGHPPCIDNGGGTIGPRQQAVLTVGLRQGDVSCSSPWVGGRSAVGRNRRSPLPLPAGQDDPEVLPCRAIADSDRVRPDRAHLRWTVR